MPAPISSTDTVCQWSFKTKAGHGNEGQPIDVSYPPSKPQYKALPGPLAADELREAREKLLSCEGAALAMKWILDPEPPECIENQDNNNEDNDSLCKVFVPSVEDGIKSEGFKSCESFESKLLYFRDFFSFSQTQIESIAEATKEQNVSALWHSIRLHRVTASVFGKAIRASSNNRSCETLFKQMSGTAKPLAGIKEVEWGITHEPIAVKCFSDKFPDMVISRTGIWPDMFGITGASPDRLCSSDAIIVVKCPYYLRNASSLKDALSLEKNQKCFITFDEDGDLNLDTSHDYFHQTQGQLYLTNRSKCNFITWISKDMLVLQIDKQSDWSEKFMPCIYSFFFIRYLPHFFST